jgi:hypothetical protein
MRAFALLFLGVVGGWVASGVDWSREAVGEESIADAARASGSLNATTQAKIANAEPSPQWNSVPTNGPRRVWETRMEVDANGQQHLAKVSRLVNADGSIVPETPQELIGRFQASAYGSPSGHGCYIVDTMTGKTWHVAPGIGRQIMTEGLLPTPLPPSPVLQSPNGPHNPPEPVPSLAPTPSYTEATQGLGTTNRPAPAPNVAPTPVPQSAEPESDDAN